MLDHGGNIRQVAQLYGRPVEEWLDLSTGINPWGWPVPDMPASVWRTLPEEQDGLEQAAQAFYRCNSLLPVAGTQQAIQLLPGLRARSRVGILSPTYSEHYRAWSQGHDVVQLGYGEIEQALDQLDVLLIVRPNNPDGHMIDKARCLEWHQRLASRGGWLIADEAFIDARPGNSLASETAREGLIVLRSMGKFFGLAGIRCGFVLADQVLLNRLREYVGPWAVSGPARRVASLALADEPWQRDTRIRVEAAQLRLIELLSSNGLEPTGGTELFQLVRTPRAAVLYDSLASQGVLTRIFRELSSIRFGLPGDENQWNRLQRALNRT
ncbi:MAG: threonine-phosphate decarboxylase CobD [Candidatus Sedimenticola sp. PURPLELP]